MSASSTPQGGATPPAAPPAPGGATPPAPTPPVADAPPTTTPTPDAPLGTAGLAALERERQARRDAEAEVARLRSEHETEQQRAIREAVEAAEKRVAGEYDTRLRDSAVEAAVTAAAATRLSDPADAILAGIDPAAVYADGKVDKAKIEKALDALVKAKPYLAAKGTPPSGDTGPKGTPAPASGPTDLNRLLRTIVTGT